MTPEFDVFRNDKSDEGIWLTAVNSRAEGEAYIQKLAVKSIGGYFIFSQKSGTRQTIAAPQLPAQSDLGARNFQAIT